MSGNVKDLIRAAQAAEIRGDRGQAIEYLKKAASLYESAGNAPRAQQMLRHAQRLSGSGAAAARMPRPDGAFEERGPVLAAENVEAWCSFCCRPRREVGLLIAGPAGSFICAACAAEADRLLRPSRGIGSHVPFKLQAVPPQLNSGESNAVSIRLRAPTASGPRRAHKRAITSPTFLSTDLVGRKDSLALFDLARRLRSSVILVVGPAGSGKTAFLRALESNGHGRYVELSEGEVEIEPNEPVLIDLQQPAPKSWSTPTAFWTQLGKLPVTLAARGDVPKAAFTLGTAAGKVPLYSTEELAACLDGWLPLWLLEQVSFVIPLPRQNATELRVLAEALASRREEKISAEMLTEISALAAKSKRGTHELMSLLRRIPSGEVKVEQPPPRPIKKKKDR